MTEDIFLKIIEKLGYWQCRELKIPCGAEYHTCKWNLKKKVKVNHHYVERRRPGRGRQCQDHSRI
jgi:hypothetical protein